MPKIRAAGYYVPYYRVASRAATYSSFWCKCINQPTAFLSDDIKARSSLAARFSLPLFTSFMYLPSSSLIFYVFFIHINRKQSTFIVNLCLEIHWQIMVLESLYANIFCAAMSLWPFKVTMRTRETRWWPYDWKARLYNTRVGLRPRFNYVV